MVGDGVNRCQRQLGTVGLMVCALADAAVKSFGRGAGPNIDPSVWTEGLFLAPLWLSLTPARNLQLHFLQPADL